MKRLFLITVDIYLDYLCCSTSVYMTKSRWLPMFKCLSFRCLSRDPALKTGAASAILFMVMQCDAFHFRRFISHGDLSESGE